MAIPRRIRVRLWAAAALMAAATVPVITGPSPALGEAGRTAAAANAGGYWLYAADGGIFSFGSASHAGAVHHQGNDIIGMAAPPSGNGHRMARDAGGGFPPGHGRGLRR